MAPGLSKRNWEGIALGIVLCQETSDRKLLNENLSSIKLSTRSLQTRFPQETAKQETSKQGTSKHETSKQGTSKQGISKQETSKPKKKKKRMWMQNCYMKRPSQFSNVNLLNELRAEPEDWRIDLGMDEVTYTNLLALVSPLVVKNNTLFREAISPHQRLSATLRYLVTGCSHIELKDFTAISPQSLGKIIPEVCNALNQVLKDYIKFPTAEEEWVTISQDFANKWNFPNCLGAVGGKHIQVIPARGISSIVLMAIANANYEFLMVDMGADGLMSDGEVLTSKDFYDRLKSRKLNIPSAKHSPNSPTVLPYVFLGGEAFTLREDFLTPFNLSSLMHQQQIFNYRLLRARRVFENTFGILSSRFRILQTKMNVKMDTITTMVTTCCTLHNYLRKQCATTYTPYQTLDQENIKDGTVALGLRADPSVLPDIQCEQSGYAEQSAKDVREKFMAYFNGDGQVEWQERMVMLN